MGSVPVELTMSAGRDVGRSIRGRRRATNCFRALIWILLSTFGAELTDPSTSFVRSPAVGPSGEAVGSTATMYALRVGSGPEATSVPRPLPLPAAASSVSLLYPEPRRPVGLAWLAPRSASRIAAVSFPRRIAPDDEPS